MESWKQINMLQLKVYICCKTLSNCIRFNNVHLKPERTDDRWHRRTIEIMKLLRVMAHGSRCFMYVCQTWRTSLISMDRQWSHVPPGCFKWLVEHLLRTASKFRIYFNGNSAIGCYSFRSFFMKEIFDRSPNLSHWKYYL